MKNTAVVISSLLLLFCLPNSANAQQHPIRKAFYAGIGGAGLSMINLNYDREIARNWQGRVGLGFSFNFNEDLLLSHLADEEVNNRSYGITLPLTASYLIGNDKKFLELGGGITPSFTSIKTDLTERDNKFSVLPTALIGYRRHPRDKGFVFRVNIGASYAEQSIFPFLGLSFGLAP